MTTVTACRRSFILLAAAILLAFAACDSSGPGESKPEPEPETDTEAPAAPSGVSADVGGDAIEVSWDGVSAGDLSEYRVYRGTKAEPTDQIATVESESYFDPDVEEGQTYYFRVTAVDDSANESGYSSGAQAVAGLPVPGGLSASIEDQKVVLTWATEAASSRVEYRIYRGTSSKPTTQIATVETDRETYTDSDVDGAQTYYYRLKAADETGNTTSYSDEVSAETGRFTRALYVDANAPSAGAGTSWSDAFKYLQDAFDEVRAHTGTDYEIRIAKGVYYPDEDANGDHVDGDYEESFRLSRDRIEIYGGYPSGGGTRDTETNETILSGDIGQDDGPLDLDALGAHFQGVNSYHVLFLDGTTGGLTEKTVIDGLTVEGGRADRPSPDNAGAGLYCDGSGSGSVCNPSIQNVVFRGNSAEKGGAMYNNGFGGESSPTLVNVTFVGNGPGGAMSNIGGYDGVSNPTLKRVFFRRNSFGMNNEGYRGQSSPTVIGATFRGNGTAVRNHHVAATALFANVVFSGNSGDAGTFSNSESSPTLLNVVFSGNDASYGGAIYNNSLSLGNTKPKLINVIIWGNSAYKGNQIYNDGDAKLTISHSIVEGGVGGRGVWNAGRSSTVDSGGNINANPQFVEPVDPSNAPTVSGDLHLKDGSPAIDTGSNDLVPSDVNKDLDGNDRIVDGDGDGNAVVDMGAYEHQ